MSYRCNDGSDWTDRCVYMCVLSCACVSGCLLAPSRVRTQGFGGGRNGVIWPAAMFKFQITSSDFVFYYRLGVIRVVRHVAVPTPTTFGRYSNKSLSPSPVTVVRVTVRRCVRCATARGVVGRATRGTRNATTYAEITYPMVGRCLSPTCESDQKLAP